MNRVRSLGPPPHLSGAVIEHGYRRKLFRQAIVGAMNLDPVGAAGLGNRGCVGERVEDEIDLVLGERVRH